MKKALAMLLVSLLLSLTITSITSPAAEAGGGKSGAVIGGFLAGVIVGNLFLRTPVVVQPYYYTPAPRYHYPYYSSQASPGAVYCYSPRTCYQAGPVRCDAYGCRQDWIFVSPAFP